MSYHKMTSIMGYDKNNKFTNTVRDGHWKPDTALVAGRAMGLVGRVEVKHSTGDTSGLGRGGNDRAFYVDDEDVTPRELTAFEKNYDDGQDVNDAWDNIESR